MDDGTKRSNTRLRRIIDRHANELLLPGHAIILSPEMLAMLIEAVGLTRDLANAGLRDSDGDLNSLEGTRLDAVLGALLVELHALNSGARSTALVPNPGRQRADGGAQQPDNNHPIDYLLRHEAVGAYEVLRWLGVKQDQSMRFVLDAIRHALGRSTLLAKRKELAEEGKLEETRNWFFNLAVRPPLPGNADTPPDFMANSAVMHRITDRLRFTADRFLELYPKKPR